MSFMFAGTLPSDIAQCTRLMDMGMYENSFSGKLTMWIMTRVSDVLQVLESQNSRLK